jgi:hypothetical protein
MHRTLKGFAAAALVLGAPARADAPDPERAIAELRVFEAEARGKMRLAAPPPSDLGADPWTLRETRQNGLFAGILRGRSAIVLLDRDLQERSRLEAPAGTTGLAIGAGGDIYASGELSPVVARYRVRDAQLVRAGETRVPGALAVRDVAFARGRLHALDAEGGRVVSIAGDATAEARACRGASQLLAVDRSLLVNCPLQHEILVLPLGDDGAPDPRGPVTRIENDGPFWGLDARATHEGIFVAAGGIEDRPLDRTGGFFGNVDSFVYFFSIERGAARPLGQINASELGLVTPKAVVVEPGPELAVDVAAFGSAAAARVTRRGDEWIATTIASTPGVRSLARAADGAWFGADPLLDRWVRFEAGSVETRAVAGEQPKKGADVDLGEALLFTTLMAPWNTSDGPKSRFTCEACHFEGYVDGRRHHTGRGDVRVVTKPLLGLAGNKPHFTRALDPDMSSVAMNEFRVATAGNAYDPWFSVDVDAASWLRDLGVADATLAPERLRRAFVAFTLAFSHRPNVATVGRAGFSDLERRGARVFADRCERCHESRLLADDATTRVPFEGWEKMIFSPAAPIVWARAGYEKTGVVPYVHPDGARPSSLRRLAKKTPYLTSGAAAELDDLLGMVRVAPDGAFLHAGEAPGARALDTDERAALLAFLRLL